MTILKEKANHEKSNSSDFEGLKEEEIERLRGFLTSLDKPSTSCFLAKLDKSTPWLVVLVSQKIVGMEIWLQT